MNILLRTSLKALGINPDDREVARTIAVLKGVFAQPGTDTWEGAFRVACNPAVVAGVADMLPGDLRPENSEVYAAAFVAGLKRNAGTAKALYGFRGSL